LFGQKRRKVGRLQRQAARCFLVTQEADSVELGTWCWPRVVLIESSRLLSNVMVQARIAEIMRVGAERAEVTAEEVIRELKKLGFPASARR
jgi:hypothetical protein